MLAYKIGARDAETCWSFIGRLRDATVGRFQLSSDGLSAYRMAIPFVLQGRVDFGQLVKQYANLQGTVRYSPAKIIGAERKVRFGNPDESKICPSHVESLNQKLRISLRRFTRLTDGHSKGYKQHRAMQAIFFAWYNWCRKHSTIKTTPAVSAGIADHQWTIKELIERAAEA